ncbi:MAG: hypothetical protein K6U03_03495 [Firmicutes bacterium]|nr:hypothetical protein [Bacillota bacterium]
MIGVHVDFSKKIRDWDGFGVNYVETSQTYDYAKDPQDYGGLSLLSEEDRRRVIDLIFGDDGLKPGIVKMFLDPFHQAPSKVNKGGLKDIDMSNYDHTTTTHWMRYFVREGLAKTRACGRDLTVFTTLYGPPGWMTKQRAINGRDLDPEFKYECAKYIVSWAKYLRDVEGIPVKYVSLHNEGEDYHRWPEDGSSNIGTGHDYNMYWPPEQVVEFIKLVRDILDAQGMHDVGVTPGETTNWTRFSDWGYADAIAEDPEALEKLGLITSHSFYSGTYGRWYGDHRSLGNDIIREKRPGIHSWVTSTSWSKMDAKFIYEIRGNIYSAKVNAVTPWACMQVPSRWVGGDPNPGTAIRVYEDGTYALKPGYYFYKQVSRAGQPGTAVAKAIPTDTEVGVIAFASNGTKNSDAFVIINIAEKEKSLEIKVSGSCGKFFEAYRTSPDESYVPLGRYGADNGAIRYNAPPGSATTFFSMEKTKEG